MQEQSEDDEDLIFLSYSTDDKRLSHNIKDELEIYGFEVFLAHEDLVPSEEWQQRIKAELRRCEVSIPLLSENFRPSDWTDQEAGYALSRERDCLILSLLVPPIDEPHGFLKQFQALRLNTKSKYYIPTTCEEIATAIHERFGTNEGQKARAIDKFAKSSSFAEAKRNVRGLFTFDEFTPQQVDQILLASVANDQIYQAFGLDKKLRNLFAAHGHLASPRVSTRFIERFKL